MIKNILAFSLRNRWLVIASSLLLMAVGYYSFTHLKIEAYPDIADTNVIVIAQYQGRAAEEVEQQITIPIEIALQSTPNVIDRRSRTIFGLGVVQLSFEDGIDDYFARQQVMERLSMVELPDDVVLELAPLSTAVGEIFRYVVEAPPTFTPMELRDLQDWVIIPHLLQTAGVAEVSTFGGPLKQFQILTSPDKLRKYDLTIADVEEAVKANNRNTGGNVLNRGGQGFSVRGIGLLKNEKDIENIALKSENGLPVFVRDVASVEIAPPPPSGVLGYTVKEDDRLQHEGLPEIEKDQNPRADNPVIDISNAVEGIVLLRRYENPSDVLVELKQRIEHIQEYELPEGVRIRTLYDRTFLIDHSLRTVATTLFEGISIVVIILIFFLGSARSALVVAATIPFSLLFAFILMRYTGIPANLLSLGAIDFGIIVDGGVIMAEHLIRTYRTATPKEKQKGILHVTIHSAQRVSREVFFSVTIIVLAYMPILLMSRVEGKLFSPMALTLAFAVVGSLLAALTLIPVLISFVYHKAFQNPHTSMKERKNAIISFAEKQYEKVLDKLLKYHKQAVLIGFALVLLLISFGSRLGTEFLPELDEGSIFIRANFPAGITIEENAKYAPLIRKIIADYPQVSYVISQTGRNDDGTDPFPTNRNEILIGLKDYSLWTDTISKKELVVQMIDQLENAIPGVSFTSGQPIIDQVMEIVTGSAADLAVSIVGDDLVMMRTKADSIADMMKTMHGSEGVDVEQEGMQAQLAIDIDREKIARYGIDISDIQNMVEAAIGGKYISVLYDGTRRYDIVARYLPEYRDNIDEIKKMLVPSSNGALIPMDQLTDIRLVEGQTNIYRYDNKRMVTVRSNIRGVDQGGFVSELKKRIENELQIPKGYEIIYGGQYENLERAGKQLAFTIPLTLILVLVLLFMLYKNLKNTLVTMSCVLFALAGGISALLLRGYYFNVSAGVGFVSIFGISVMAGVLLVSALDKETKTMLDMGLGNVDLSGNKIKSLVRQTSKTQLRAVLSILVLAIFGLVPASISSGIGSDVQRPLATVIIGGLTSTLVFAPVLIPPLYWWTMRKKLGQSRK